MVSLAFIKFPEHVKTPLLISFLISSLSTLVVLTFSFSLQPVVPIFYTLPEPSDYLVSKWWLILFPFISFAMSITHFALLRVVAKYEKILQVLFVWTTVALQVILLLGLLRIVRIVS